MELPSANILSELEIFPLAENATMMLDTIACHWQCTSSKSVDAPWRRRDHLLRGDTFGTMNGCATISRTQPQKTDSVHSVALLEAAPLIPLR